MLPAAALLAEANSAAQAGMSAHHPVTPDGRYFVVRGRLWRTTNPYLAEMDRIRLTRELMDARREVGRALRAGDPAAVTAARGAVDRAKVALGERGPVWWNDGATDFNRRLARNTPYAEWFRLVDPGAGRAS
jgi:hypothetical protein